MTVAPIQMSLKSQWLCMSFLRLTTKNIIYDIHRNWICLNHFYIKKYSKKKKINCVDSKNKLRLLLETIEIICQMRNRQTVIVFRRFCTYVCKVTTGVTNFILFFFFYFNFCVYWWKNSITKYTYGFYIVWVTVRFIYYGKKVLDNYIIITNKLTLILLIALI